MTDGELDRVLREWATSEDPARGEGCRAAGPPTEVVRYVDRAGLKDAPEVDLGKANNYAHRLVTGDWRAAKQGERGVR